MRRQEVAPDDEREGDDREAVFEGRRSNDRDGVYGEQEPAEQRIDDFADATSHERDRFQRVRQPEEGNADQ